jgi:hypothetical protein
MKNRYLAACVFVSLTITSGTLSANSGVGGGTVSTPIKISKGGDWVKINSQPINLGDIAATCTVTASGSISVTNQQGGTYSLGLGMDQALPQASAGCIRSSKITRRSSQEVSDVCLFDGLKGSHSVDLYAKTAARKTTMAYADKSGLIIHCSENHLGLGSGGANSITQTINIINNIGSTQTFYVGLNNKNFAPYTQQFWENQGCQFNTGNSYACSFSLANNATQTFTITQGVNVAISAGVMVWSECGGNTGLSMAELNLNTTPYNQDYYDVSLVNGFNYAVSIAPLVSTNPNVPAPSSTSINITSLTGNSNIAGVYPAGMDICVASQSPAQGAGCPESNYPKEAHGGTQYDPNPVCQAAQPATYPTVPIYNLTFSNP